MQPLWLPVSDQVVTVRTIGSDRTKRSIHAAPVFKVGGRNGAVLEVRHLGEQRDDLLGMRERQWAEQHPVNHGKDRGIGANAERQRENGD